MFSNLNISYTNPITNEQFCSDELNMNKNNTR